MADNDYMIEEVDILELMKKYEKKLYSNISIPSPVQTYSLCVEYMREWIMKEFKHQYNEDFFKTVHIEGKHMFDDWMKYNNRDLLKKLKPSLSIIPQIDYEFDREGLDKKLTGLSMYNRRNLFRNCFFKDDVLNLHLGVVMKLLLVNFNFRVRVSTKSQQLNIAEFMKYAFRVGATQGHDVDFDFHVPYNLVMRIAKDIGYEVRDGKVTELIKFMNYLNKRSYVPFLLKFRNVNGKHEFFVRFSSLYVHIHNQSISIDDGEREGGISSNFYIDMQCAVRFPGPAYYLYYSEKQIDGLGFSSDDGSISFYPLPISRIPDINDKGWQQYTTSGYAYEDLTKPLTINFAELLEGTDLKEYIDKCKNRFISPEVFIEIKLYNEFELQDYVFDWEKLILTTKNIMKSEHSYLVIYVDNKFLNENEIIKGDLESPERMKEQ